MNNKGETMPEEKELIGWIAMDENKKWYFYDSDPCLTCDTWIKNTVGYVCVYLKNYTPKTKPEDWKKSKQPVYI